MPKKSSNKAPRDTKAKQTDKEKTVRDSKGRFVKGSPPPTAFKKGDPRINRKGRPKTFDKMRELAQEISEEAAKTPDGKELLWDGRQVTAVEYVLRRMAYSKNPTLLIKFLEIAYGKVPDNPTDDGKHAETIDKINSITEDLHS